ILDVELVVLYPWATACHQLGFFGLSAALVFIALITVPYVLEWRRGGLDWD
ncbi:NADH-quinone oxidoreductase subunit A, partial [Actinomyces urogenitalis]|uniref:NADH-quinone oxidoreductase subunit A n=1 Tax=Actinomyces urogenitalis TaxID=103621 RepID=UPI00242D7BDC